MDRVHNRPDIEGAIERSRAARSRRRRRRFGLAACATILLGGGTALSIAGLNANDTVEAAVAQVRSLADLLGQRSPGERTTAELNKTKRVKRPLAAAGIAPPSPLSAELADILLPPAEAGDGLQPIAILAGGPPPSLLTFLNPPGGPIIPLPGGEDLIPPPGGSNGTPPVVNLPVDNPHVGLPSDEPKETIPVTPLPEPGTWATMLLGFGLMGWWLRRQTGRASLA